MSKITFELCHIKIVIKNIKIIYMMEVPQIQNRLTKYDQNFNNDTKRITINLYDSFFHDSKAIHDSTYHKINSKLT